MTEQVAVPADKSKKARRTADQVIAGLREQAAAKEKALKERSLKELHEAIKLAQVFAAKYPASQAAKTVTQAIGLLNGALTQPF